MTDLTDVLKSIALAGAAPYLKPVREKLEADCPRIVHVATNNFAPLETKKLGEDGPLIADANAAFLAFAAALERLIAQAASEDANAVAREFLELLHDARNDASWGGLVLRAAEAYEEAKVKRIASRFAPPAA